MNDLNNPTLPPAPEAPPPVQETPPDVPALKSRTSIISRREFITALIGGGATLVAAATLADPITQLLGTPAANGHHGSAEGDPSKHWVMVIDLGKCVGCDYCVYACQATNDTRTEARWNIRLTDQTAQGNTFYITRPCLHCDSAPCVSVCPVTATYKRADGLVMMDYAKCIGCRYCQTACPYGARVFNWTERTDINPMTPEWGTSEVQRRPRGVVEKCTFCVHRIDHAMANGLTPGVHPEATPACVNICPVTARWFGDLNDPTSEVSHIIATKPTLRLREDLGTEPNVYYIPPEGMF